MKCCNNNCNQGRDCPNRVRRDPPDFKKLFRMWKQHLANSRLSSKQQTSRAKEFSRKGIIPNDTWTDTSK